MSLHTVGSDAKYILPASQDAIPEAFRSNRMAKPIPCSVQTVNIPALSGDAQASGTSILQVPCGASAGIMMNPYLRFSLKYTSTGAAANSGFYFKGAVRSAASLINRLSTYVNSVQVDNIQNFDQVADTLFAHSTSNDWITHDATLMLGANVPHYLTTASLASPTYTYCVPLIGLLGSQQALPLYLINGQLQVQIDWNALSRQYAMVDANDAAISASTFSNIQLVYDRVQPEQAFIDRVRSQMAAGQKYVYGYTNYQNTTLATINGQSTLNFGLNVSSLRGVLASQVLTANLSAVSSASAGRSVSNDLSQFIVTLDGRLINSLTLNALSSPALVFAELQKANGRIFDASITDVTVSTAGVAGTGAVGGGTFLTQNFAVGVSAQRVNEGLAFSGSPVSICSIQVTTGADAHTMFVTFVSDYQMLIDDAGAIELVR